VKEVEQDDLEIFAIYKKSLLKLSKEELEAICWGLFICLWLEIPCRPFRPSDTRRKEV